MGRWCPSRWNLAVMTVYVKVVEREILPGGLTARLEGTYNKGVSDKRLALS